MQSYIAVSLQPYFSPQAIRGIEREFLECNIGEHRQMFMLRLLVETQSSMTVKPEDLLELELLRRLLAAKHTESEAEEVLRFLSGFCKTAKIYLVDLFIRARIYKYPGKTRKTFQDVMAACVRKNDAVWKRSSPGRYADPDDTATDDTIPTYSIVVYDGKIPRTVAGIKECIGNRNFVAMSNVYTELGLPFKGLH